MECRAYHNQNASDVCTFITNTENCQIDEGYVNYLSVFYCSFAGVEVLGMILTFLFLLVCFIGLGLATDNYFRPSLLVIAKTLRLSDNITGVTFLACGNGAPDLFTSISAILSSQNADASLALGALVGAAILVTTVVAGSICFMQPFQSMQRPLLRDVIFSLVAVYTVFAVFYYGRVAIWHALLFIGVYAVYVVVVVVGRYIHNRLRKKQQSTEPQSPTINTTSINVGDNDGLPTETTDTSSSEKIENIAPDNQQTQTTDAATGDDTPLLATVKSDDEQHPGHEFLLGICPVDLVAWRSKGVAWKCFEAGKAPIILLFNLTTPVGRPDNWNKYQYAMLCITAPLTALLLLSQALSGVSSTVHIVLWVAFALTGVLFAIIVIVKTKRNTSPKYMSAFAYLGFVVAVLWIYTISNEIVNMLRAYGVTFNISDAILGLTLLAWGNSIADFVADTAVAKDAPRAGISACFGGPLFNLLLGLGIPFTIQIIRHGGSVMVQLTFLQVILLLFLALSLLSTLIVVPLCRFRFTRFYGAYLILLYATFLLVALLVEFKVINVTM